MPNIQHFIFPQTLQIISPFAFRYSSISKLIFPPSITEIGPLAALEGCSNLTEISFSAPCENYRIEDNCLISNLDNRLVRARSNIEVFNLNISIVGSSAFSMTNIQKFIATKNLIKFENYAFVSSFDLNSLDLTNSSIESLSYNCFQNCRSLYSIVIPPSVRSIGDNAFLWSNNIRTVIYLGSSDFQNVKAFDSPSSVRVYVLSSYDYDKFCQASVHRISYLDLHHYIIFGQISCNYRCSNYNYIVFLVFIFM